MNDQESRDVARQEFLRGAGLAPEQADPLTGDASNRRYFRIKASGQILMDAPAELGEDVRPFAAVTGWLRRHGFSAPRIDATDYDQGFLLLEDLETSGGALYCDVCVAAPESEECLYAAAVDALAEIFTHPVPDDMPFGGGAHPLAPYDSTALLREARLAIDWYLPGATKDAMSGDTSPDLVAEYTGLITEAVAPVAEVRETVVLRDYHAENLLWLPEREGIARVGLLDYQDALAGHAAYDLVSLLEDARRDVPEALSEAMIARFLDRTDVDPQIFRRAYSALGAQRNLKIIGIFARLALRDGKTRYSALIRRVWEHLQRDLSHPDLVALKAWVARHLPPPESDVLDRLSQGGGQSGVDKSAGAST